ncbi:MAG: hypothetical protein JWO31_1286, partial [Phycisphaerales bacterium]|nr:hypothetical protein [Phycisphaerales bacterium]
LMGGGVGGLMAARDAAAALDALDKKKGMREAAEKIIESIKTPADILAEKLDEIQRLWLAGLLTAEQVEAANAKAAEEAAGKETATEHGDHFADTKVGVFERRFTAGFQGTDGDAQDKAVALARQQLAEQKATRRAIEKQPVIKGKSI